MTLSVKTNQNALVALQNLNSTNEQLASVQNRISTGLKVQNAKDNAAVWSIAQDQRSDIRALDAVNNSLNRASSIAEVSLAAGETVSDLLVELKQKVLAATDTSIDAGSRAALDADFKATLRQITQVINSASFNGANIIDGSLSADISFLANADATGNITLSLKNMSLGGAIISIAAAASLGTPTLANSVLAQLNTSLAAVNSALGDIGAQAKQIEAHRGFVDKLRDVLEVGVGNLVDADLAKESAKLQALQVQQQLGAQALSIANQNPQVILSLFRGG